MITSALVTIAIPAFNNIIFFKQALFSAMAQTYSNTEILIIDDSSDDSIEIFLANSKFPHPLKYIKNMDNLGFRKNFDKCWEYANGQYVMILHQDDIMLPNLVERYVEIFNSSKTVGAVCCQSLAMNKKQKLRKRTKKFVNKEYDLNLFLHEFFLKGHPEIATLMLKSDLIKGNNKLHFYHEDNPYYDDYYFWIDLAFNTNIFFLSDELFIRRIHSNQTSKVIRKLKYDFFIEICNYVKWVIYKTLPILDEKQKRLLYNWSFSKTYHTYLLYYKTTNKEYLLSMIRFLKNTLSGYKYIGKKVYFLLLIAKLPYPLDFLTFIVFRTLKLFLSRALII